ncbi:MAG: hypothetical protein ACI9U2_001958 [Bradymonadia bacterium]|jgi:hypothetical protein
MRFTVQHTFPIAFDRFFTEMFFDPDYSRTLYLETLGCGAFDIEREDRDASGMVEHRTVRVQPKLNMPKPVAKLLGTTFTYREVGTMEGMAWESQIVPSRLADKVTVRTVMAVTPLGEDTCLRTAEFDIQVRIFGLGKVFEGFIERTLRESYAKASAHSIRWLNARVAP